MELIIRDIQPEDSEAVNELSNQLGYTLSIEETREQILKVIANKEHSAYVAITEKKLIGWIHVFVALTIEARPFSEIAGLVVDEKYRNKGVGKKLVEKIFDWSVSKNIDAIRVRCSTKRLQSHKFYKKIGFSELKEQKVFLLNLKINN